MGTGGWVGTSSVVPGGRFGALLGSGQMSVGSGVGCRRQRLYYLVKVSLVQTPAPSGRHHPPFPPSHRSWFTVDA